MSQLDPVAGLLVGRELRLLSWGLALVSFVLTCVQWWLVPDFYEWGYGLSAIAALLAPLLIAVPGVVRRKGDPLVPMAAFVIVGTALRLLDPLVANPPAGNVDYPPLIQSAAAAMIVAGFVFRPAMAAGLVSLHLMGVLYGRAGTVGVVQSVAEVAIDATVGFIPLLVVGALRTELEAAARAGRDAEAALWEAKKTKAFSAAQWNVDGLLHDKVLGSLKHAADGQIEAASHLAVAALRQVEGMKFVDSGPVEAEEAISRYAASQSVRLELSGDLAGWPDGPSGRALLAATQQAISNVGLHTPDPHTATLRANSIGDDFVVDITDDGPGFDPSRIPADRRGVRRIYEGIADVGGHVTFGPQTEHLGTRIRLRVPAGSGAGHSGGPEGQSHDYFLASIFWVLALSTAGFEVTAYLHRGAGQSDIVTYLGMAGIVVLPLLMLRLKSAPLGDRQVRRLDAAVLLAVVTVAVWGALMVNVADPSVSDWRFWFIGSFNATLAILTVKRGPALGLIVVLAATLVGFSGLQVRAELHLLPALGATFQCVAIVLMAGWVMRGIDTAKADINRDQEIFREARAEAHTTDAARTEIARRLKRLDPRLLPMLSAIGSRAQLSGDERLLCAQLERSTRDNYLAHTLLTPELLGAIDATRQRGCSVKIEGRADTDDPELPTFRTNALQLLKAAEAGDEVILLWWATGPLAGTAVLNGSHPGTRVSGDQPWPVETSINPGSIFLPTLRKANG